MDHIGVCRHGDASFSAGEEGGIFTGGRREYLRNRYLYGLTSLWFAVTKNS